MGLTKLLPLSHLPRLYCRAPCGSGLSDGPRGQSRSQRLYQPLWVPSVHPRVFKGPRAVSPNIAARWCSGTRPSEALTPHHRQTLLKAQRVPSSAPSPRGHQEHGGCHGTPGRAHPVLHPTAGIPRPSGRPASATGPAQGWYRHRTQASVPGLPSRSPCPTGSPGAPPGPSCREGHDPLPAEG